MKQKMSRQLRIHKLALLLTITLIGSISTNAQSFNIGARAGASLSNWNLSNVEYVSNSSTINPEFALLAELKISKSFSIQPEVAYSVYGTRLKYQGDYTIKVKSDYIQIPVLAKYNLPNGVSFFAGPQVGFLLKSRTKDSDGQKQDIKGMLKKNDFFIVAGIEYNFPMGISIAARYNAGLTNIYDVNIQDSKVKNTAFGLSVGYKFSAGKWN